MVLPMGTTWMRLWRRPSSTNQPMTGSQSGAACCSIRRGCGSTSGADPGGRTGVATLILTRASFFVQRSQVLHPPGPQSLVLNEVVVHRWLAVVAEVQHPRLTVQEAPRVAEQAVQREKLRSVRRQLELSLQ